VVTGIPQFLQIDRIFRTIGTTNDFIFVGAPILGLQFNDRYCAYSVKELRTRSITSYKNLVSQTPCHLHLSPYNSLIHVIVRNSYLLPHQWNDSDNV